MNKYLSILLFVISFITNTLKAQQWKSTGALKAMGSPYYLTAATNLDNNIFVVSAEQTFAQTSDKGATWSVPTITKPKGTFTYLKGIKDRLYTSMKVNTYDYELQYSINNGISWKLDTIGLPRNSVKTGKSNVIIEYMKNDYMLAHNNLKAYYKKIGETAWKQTLNSATTIIDITAISNKWLAIIANKIMQSIDNGTSWSEIITSGLPDNFQGYLITSNNSDRLFISNAPAAGGEDIYYSDDSGMSWTLTNSGGKFNYANSWIKDIYVVNDYIFASINPKSLNFVDAPPYLVSSNIQPDFSVGDNSGFPTGTTTSPFPFFFHIDNQLFTMFGDLYTSEPGFNKTASITDEKYKNIKVGPNPVEDYIKVYVKDQSNWTFFTIDGKKINSGTVSYSNDVISTKKIKTGIYILKIKNKKGTKSFQIIKR